MLNPGYPAEVLFGQTQLSEMPTLTSVSCVTMPDTMDQCCENSRYNKYHRYSTNLNWTTQGFGDIKTLFISSQVSPRPAYLFLKLEL